MTHNIFGVAPSSRTIWTNMYWVVFFCYLTGFQLLLDSLTSYLANMLFDPNHKHWKTVQMTLTIQVFITVCHWFYKMTSRYPPKNEWILLVSISCHALSQQYLSHDNRPPEITFLWKWFVALVIALCLIVWTGYLLSSKTMADK